MKPLALDLQRIGLTCCSVCLIGTAITVAQPSAVTGAANSPIQPAAVWSLQAQITAKELGLSTTESDRLSESYVAIRKSRRELLKALSKEEADSENHRQEVEEINAKMKAQLETAIRDVVSEQQAELAFASLGSFNPRWDRYVSQIQAYKLDPQKKQAAFRLAYRYIVDYGTARSTATAQGVRLSSVTARDLKATLDEGLGELLSEAQLSQWNETTAFRSGGAKKSAAGGKKQGEKVGGRKSPAGS